jgi:uncharacterized protein (DUF58 family)
MTGNSALDIKIHAETVAANLPALLIDAQRIAATVSHGVPGRRRVGQGETFWQFRQYESSDAATSIDWRQSAKSQRLYVRETEWEAAQTTWLWRDASPSMQYASTPDLATKAYRAELLLLALSFLLMRAGERFTLMGGGVSPGSGRAAFDRLVEVLVKQSATAQETGGASLPEFEPLPRYAQVVLFSDLLAPLDDIRNMVGRLAARGATGHIIQILDPAEETLPFAGRIRFEGMEGEGQHLLGRAQSARTDYRASLARHRDALREMTRRTGWRFSTHQTDHSPESLLLALYTAMAPPAGRR